MRFYFRISVAALAVSLLLCKGGNSPASARENSESHREWNDIARFLAGMEPDAGSTISDLEGLPAAESQRAYFAKIWPEVEKTQLEPQRKWRDEVLGKTEGFIFYPFSGADFLNIYTFFPQGSEYVFFGLEPPGPPPSVKGMKPADVNQSLAGLQVSLRSILNYSFFQTLHMVNDLKATKLSGVAPVLLVFAARTGNKVHSVHNIRLHPDGKIESLPDPFSGKPEPPATSEDYVSGIRVVFQKPGATEYTHMDYFSIDISEEGLAKKPYFLKYIQSLGTPTTYLKAASYLMYNKDFTTIRNFILDESKVILQDDSGIPLQYFKPQSFDLTFYGSYTRPIPLFDGKYQKDLYEMYLPKNHPKPLPFGIGYKFRKGDSNLMLAKRKTDRPDIPAPPKQ